MGLLIASGSVIMTISIFNRIQNKMRNRSLRNGNREMNEQSQPVGVTETVHMYIIATLLGQGKMLRSRTIFYFDSNNPRNQIMTLWQVVTFRVRSHPFELSLELGVCWLWSSSTLTTESSSLTWRQRIKLRLSSILSKMSPPSPIFTSLLIEA